MEQCMLLMVRSRLRLNIDPRKQWCTFGGGHSKGRKKMTYDTFLFCSGILVGSIMGALAIVAVYIVVE